MESALQAEGLFESVSLSLIPVGAGRTALHIAVIEKMTFLPLPFAMYASNGFSAGGIVMDTNAFGIRHTIMAGGYYSSTTLMGLAMYDMPAQNDHTPGASLFVSFSKNEPKINNINNKRALEYENMALRADLKMTEKITEHTSAMAGLGFRLLRANDGKDALPAAADSASIGTASLGWSYTSSDWNGWFNSVTEVKAQISLSQYFGTAADVNLARYVTEGMASASWQKPVFTPRLRAVGRLAADFLWTAAHQTAHVAEYKNGSAVGITLLPSYFRTNKIIGAAAGAEFALYKFKYGLLSIYGNYELVWTRDFSLDAQASNDLDEFCHGPNGGLRFYLSKIAFPAVAVGVTYNIPKNYFQFAAAIGISM